MNTKKMVLSALFLAIGIILPSITMQIPAIGNMLLPMHIPVLLCGFICGAPYGAVVGFIVPLLRSAAFGMPVMMPVAFAMAIELLCYGMFSGILYDWLKGVKGRIHISLIATMLIGRAAWGIVAYGLYSFIGGEFSWMIFVSQAFLNAIPGIIIQLIVIPAIVVSVGKMELGRDRKCMIS